ncbi:hypothetical protein AeRB84_002523 [Aphanomyces euteiches]|nr:hypothetical protein AeRB84_002523 [Aphanomyces euteiches]
MKKSSCISSCEHVAKYYLNVIVQDPQFDVEWLTQYLNPTATVEWAADTFPVTTENMTRWTSLQLTRLVVNPRAETPNTWRELLPQLHHLTHLCVDDDTGDLAEIYEMVANSEQITAFEIYSLKYTLGNADLLHLIEWFRRQPVQVFEWRSTDWISLDDDLRQELCEAMFNCPTLDRLWLSNVYLQDIDFTNLAFSMKTLSIDEWKTLTSDFLLDLGSSLEGSKLTHLELSGDIDGEFEGIECLLRALSLSSIKWFSFTQLGDYDKSWTRSAPLLENCGLDCLSLTYEDFKSAIPPHLLNALQNNQTICELHFDLCVITLTI